MNGLIIFVICGAILFWILFGKKKTKENKAVFPENYRQLLEDNVAFYRSLDDAGKIRFEEKIKAIFSYITISGVNTTIDDLDKLLVASSAVIPIFGFNEWRYYNLRNVLLYEDTFTADQFSTTDKDRNTLGMVGTGAMQQMMILSKPALRLGFKNETDKNNTGIHEFVHLLDKADGETDGIPEQLLQKQYTIPWLNLMNDSITEIREGKSDINIYGATSKTEFFAVAAEYFFERPDLLQQKHPELFALLEQAFHQIPATIKTK
ncbi:zinc-dependent peptidase [Panacibacter ginsenosidivorans]|uniref:Zinc-dependent peptidase n=1 Tax=Panacibacter ginsenosidivorans TaxID=1813871 RepID=A0A5B8VAR5_9BACT|nr:M90 family metallopeptidase [Panacibacter ginsenosidivorans]QEC68053.1 zinc-dependent peptidase [Panacibacter ginsenosidivorans]